MEWLGQHGRKPTVGKDRRSTETAPVKCCLLPSISVSALSISDSPPDPPSPGNPRRCSTAAPTGSGTPRRHSPATSASSGTPRRHSPATSASPGIPRRHSPAASASSGRPRRRSPAASASPGRPRRRSPAASASPGNHRRRSPAPPAGLRQPPAAFAGSPCRNHIRGLFSPETPFYHHIWWSPAISRFHGLQHPFSDGQNKNNAVNDT